MKYQVRLTEKAEQDVATVLDWFGEPDALPAARKWFGQLMAAIDTLETMPGRCGVAAESADVGVEIRELLVGKRHGIYRVIFQLEKRTVFILRIRHAAREALSRDDL